MVDYRIILKSIAAAMVFAAGTTFCPAQTAPGANAPVFSKPADGGMPGPDSSEPLPIGNSSENDLHALNPGEQLPPPSPDLSPDLQQKLKERANWTLQTPEEIMGLQTPEEIFGLKTEDQNTSPEERYLQRIDKAKTKAAEDGLSQQESQRHEFTGLFDSPDDHDPLFSSHEQSDSSSFSRMFKDSNVSPFAGNNGSLGGAKAAAANAMNKAKEDQDQAEEMARFRSLIGEAPLTPGTEFDVPHPETTLHSPPSSAFDEFGRPAVIHTTELSKPDGLTLPPEIVGYAAPIRKAKKPSWEPQSPPWLSESVAPPSAPAVRKFY